MTGESEPCDFCGGSEGRTPRAVRAAIWSTLLLVTIAFWTTVGLALLANLRS
jgi:hypothetical protein